MPRLSLLARVGVVAAGLAIGSAANAAAPAAVGKRALLTLNIQIDGAGQRASRSEGVDVKWSTRRVLDARIEMVATKAQGTSAVQATSESAGGSDMAALQKEAAKCKSEDTACQMAIAMKMMESADAKNMMAGGPAALRYQTWEPAPKGGRVEVKGDYQEQWDGVFLTASREVRSCKAVYSSTTPAAKDRATLLTGLDGNHVEVDTETGKSSLMLVIGSYVAGESKCHINDGGKIFDERENTSLTFGPPVDTKTGGWVAGGVAAGTAISRGELNYVTKPTAQSEAGLMSVTAPLKVKVRWELVPL